MKITFIVLTIIVLFHYFFFLFGFTIVDGLNSNFYLDKNITIEEKGVFGDYTSGHFSILAFLWLTYGIIIQSKEFGLQRKEFENQTEQFKEQNKLFDKQLKELEIQSIRNIFDSYILKLNDLEKNISNILSYNGDIYEFIKQSEKSSSLKEHMKKIPSIEKYVRIYDKLENELKSNENIVNLLIDLELLKKDVYDGLKMSYLILLHYIIQSKQPNKSYTIELSQKKISELEQLNVYNILNINYEENQNSFNAVSKITNEFNELHIIDILN